MSPITSRLAAVIVILIVAPCAAAAEDPRPSPDRQEAGDRPGLEEDEFDSLDLLGQAARLRPRLRLQQDFTPHQRHDDAEVDSYTTALRASIAAPVTQGFAVRVVAKIEATQSDFHGDERFLDTGRNRGDPFDELFDSRFRLEGRYRVSDDWSLLAAGSIGSSWESGSDYGEGLRGSGSFAVGYFWRKRVSVIVGVRVGSRVAASGVRVRPLFKLGWRVTDEFEVETRNLGLRVSYKLQRGLQVYVSSELKSQSYRLEDRGGEVGKGLLQNRTLPTILGVSWKPNKHWRLRAHAGAIAYQRYAVRDDDRKTVDRSTANGPAFTGRLDLQFRF